MYEEEKIAEDLDTPIETLRKLAESNHEDVRCIVARNPNTPPDPLRELAKNKNSLVRGGVAKNPNTPPDALGKLALAEVKKRAKENLAW